MQFTLAIGLILLAGETVQSTDKWRADYEAGLRAPDGWLSLAGLTWLHNGMNEILLPVRCGGKAFAVEFHDGHATLHPHTGASVTVNGVNAGRTELSLDKSVVETCGTSATFINRGERFGIRLRDPEAKTRREFRGLKWFPVNDKCRVQAKWRAYPAPKLIPITNVLGDTRNEASPGYAEFVLGGKTYKLEPTIEDGLLFFMFRDLTSSDLTYGSGRFLKAAMPTSDLVTLDFNRAYNPPCAYTEFATCPLPPKQNRMAVRVEAGQQRYGVN